MTFRRLAKEWSLGCVNHAPAARESCQDAGITQPRDHSLAYPCMFLYLIISMIEETDIGSKEVVIGPPDWQGVWGPIQIDIILA